MEVCVTSKLTTFPGSARRAHLIIAEARRLGLGNTRIERANSSPHLAAEFNGVPISVPLALMLAAAAILPRRFCNSISNCA